ncbi:MAG: hypothetical protein IJA60_01060 [Clostridia bacterium]|nr:hypothetical protein [Clostridia bacterium]
MKKIISLILVLVMMFTFAACSSDENTPADTEGDSAVVTTTEETTVATTEPVDVNVTETENLKLDGIYVDSATVVEEGTPLRMVYVFFTLKPQNANMKMDSKYTKMTIGESNVYDSDFYKGSCDYMPNYYYASFIEDVYVGTEAKLALTFKIPEGDLKGGKTITFSDSDFPVKDLKLTTDEVIFCENVEKIAEAADPEGYADMTYKFAPADDATVQKVKNSINGYYFTFYVSAGTQVMKTEIHFNAPNKFEVKSQFGSNSGTYDVRNGYIFCTYNSNNNTVEIPYEFKDDGGIRLDCDKAFSIYE